MKAWFLRSVFGFVRFLLRLRYRFEIEGLDQAENEELFSRPGGTLILSNHPALIDPVISFALFWDRFTPRPIATEYVYESPIVNSFMKLMRGVPVPDFDVKGNSLKRKRAEQSFRRVRQGLKDGDTFVLYPSGRLKGSGHEKIGGASWTHRLISEVPEVNVVLVRVEGLWGSMFSRAASGHSPPIFSTFKKAAWILIKNLFFLTPRRKVKVEVKVVSEGFPHEGERLEINQHLEDWFNRYEDVEEQDSTLPGPAEKLKLVSYSFIRKELLSIKPAIIQDDEKIEIDKVPTVIQDSIKSELGKLCKRRPSAILPEHHLAKDLGLDSLDGAEIILFLDDRYEIKGVKPIDLTTVGRLMAIAAGQIELDSSEEVEESDIDKMLSKWKEKWKRQDPRPPSGRTVHEAFLRTCDRMADTVACADRSSGVLTFRQVKMRVLLLAEEIEKLPGEQIGVMLPASVAANILILSCLLAGKTPVMINWTVGTHHLKSCIESTNLHVVLTSRKFTDQVEGVDLSCLAPVMIALEDIGRKIGIFQKIRAMIRSYKKTEAILDEASNCSRDESSTCGILFTSGTESKPKGVPLSHKNILSNHRATLAVINLSGDDVLYGILPPFHSFGFTVTGLFPLLIGIKVVFSPNPTDGIRLARGIDRWGITIMCSAPTFLKGIMHAATPEQLSSIRLFVSGAEKAPKDLFESISSLGENKELLEGYGITECSPVLTINSPGTKPIGVGKPLPNVQMIIVDPDTYKILKRGERGLILVRGPSIFSGYLDPAASDPFTTVNGKKWYVTGDLGFLDETGALTISGRLKRFVKIGGEMISLLTLEEVLTQVTLEKKLAPSGKGPVLAVIPVEEAGKKTELHLFTNFEIDLDAANLLLREQGMSNISRLTNTHQVEEIPLTGTGKVAYRELATELKTRLAKKV